MFVLDRQLSTHEYVKTPFADWTFFAWCQTNIWMYTLLSPSGMAMQVLFFSTIIANLVGRTLPKWKMFAIKSPTFLMYLGFVKLAAAPLCFVYLKSSDRWHSDAGASGEHFLWCHGQSLKANMLPNHVPTHMSRTVLDDRL